MNSCAFLADISAEQAGEIAGAGIAICVCVGMYVFAVFAIVRAFMRRTTGWIIAGSLGGLVMLVTWLFILAGAVSGVKTALGKTQAGSGLASLRSLSGAPQTVQGHSVPYTFTLPPYWPPMSNPAEFDTAFHHNDLYFGVVAEEVSMGTPEVIADIARKALNRKAADVRFEDPAPEQLDGRTWLKYTARCRIGTIPITYQFHVYSGDEGTFQLIGWTSQNLYDRDEGALRRLAATFRFPAGHPGSPQGAAQATPPLAGPTQTVQGFDFGYKLTLPADWKFHRSESGTFDLVASHRSLYVGVMVVEGLARTPQAAADFSQNNLRKNSRELQLGETHPIQIDGRDWLEFSAKCQTENLPLEYRYFVYSGPEGTYRVVGWTMQNLYERDAPTMRDVAMTFRFPTVKPSPSPITTAAAVPPEPTMTPAASATPPTAVSPSPTAPPKGKRRK